MALKALITGGAGFVGAHLARHLVAHDYEVVLVDNFSRGVRDQELESLAGEPGVSLHEADLLDAESSVTLPDDCDQIYHFAAIIGVQHVLARPFDVLADNLSLIHI